MTTECVLKLHVDLTARQEELLLVVLLEVFFELGRVSLLLVGDSWRDFFDCVANAELFALLYSKGLNLLKHYFHPQTVLTGQIILVIDEVDPTAVQCSQVFHQLEGVLRGQAAHDESFLLL